MSTQLDTPLYTLGAANLWQGNAADDSGVAWVVETEDGWSSSPPVRPVMEDKVAGDGSWAGTGAWAARIITLTGTAITPDRVTMLWAKESIKAAAGPRTPVPLRVDEAHLSRTALVRLGDTLTVTDLGSIAFTFSMMLVAEDPRRYDADPPGAQATGLPTGSTTGRTYPRTYPVLYGGSGGEQQGSVFFTQQGDYDQTPGVIVFTGPVITPSVRHVQTGYSLTWNTTIPYGDSLVVDLASQSALLNGVAAQNAALTPGSAWFWLVPGANELQFSGQAGTTPDGSTPAPQMTLIAASAWT